MKLAVAVLRGHERDVNIVRQSLGVGGCANSDTVVSCFGESSFPASSLASHTDTPQQRHTVAARQTSTPTLTYQYRQEQ
eukprot:m.431292 g.431292  ORF g.431292 m.431292 type:complete len:79 (-) comp17280_c0_seq1:3334-3570(-)